MGVERRQEGAQTRVLAGIFLMSALAICVISWVIFKFSKESSLVAFVLVNDVFHTVSPSLVLQQ